jgi:hypothetical protein
MPRIYLYVVSIGDINLQGIELTPEIAAVVPRQVAMIEELVLRTSVPSSL